MVIVGGTPWHWLPQSHLLPYLASDELDMTYSGMVDMTSRDETGGRLQFVGEGAEVGYWTNLGYPEGRHVLTPAPLVRPSRPAGPGNAERFVRPATRVSDRIDQLVLAQPGEHLLWETRSHQAEWLKKVMALHWGGDLPQPFFGFDLDEGLFIAEWQSDSEIITLTIDAERHTAWYDPWPPVEGEPALDEELDLDTEEAWEQLRSALTTTRP